MEVLVISACSGSKAHDEETLKYEDFESRNFQEREEELSEYKLSAKEMYTGQEHKYVKEAVRNLKEKASVDWKIVSAGYGLISPDKEIVPYEVTFNDSDIDTKKWADKIEIPEDFRNVVRKYDLVIVALGTKYLKSLSLKQNGISENPELVFLTGKTGERELPDKENISIVTVGRDEQNKYGKMMIRLKGWLLREYSVNVEKGEEFVDFADNFYEAIPDPAKQKTLDDST